MTDALYDIDVTLTVEQDAHRLAEARLSLDDDLTAGTARRDRLFKEIALLISGSDGQHDYRLVRILSACSKDGTALGTNACREGGILLIATHEDGTVLQLDGCSHMEMRVGSV